MSDYFKINSISEIHEYFNYSKPNHPLVTVLDLSKIEIPEEVLGKKLATPFYSISLKNKLGKPFKYGRNYFDFSEGALFGIAPNQVIEVDEASGKGDLGGWALYFHPDLIRGYGLMEKISDYGFFSYETNEALHLSEKEKNTLNEIIRKITEEYESNIDEFSQDVLVSNIELLLNYIKRFYSRQFITRKSQNTTIVSQFEHLIKSYFENDHLTGLPSVHFFAEKLHISDSYLSDLLKKETGLNAQDSIHSYVIELAKNDLINTDQSVSQIAYALGFEYPQYFSRLFKNKTGQTPKDYRLSLN